MPISLKIDVFGDEALTRRLNKLADRPRNLGGAYDVLKPIFFDIERKQFDSEGSSGSEGWTPLKPATVREKRRKGQRSQIMQATGSLFESLTSDSSSDWAGYYRTNEMFFGTSTEYAKYHQGGGLEFTPGSFLSTGAGTFDRLDWHGGLPQRKVVDLTSGQYRKMVTVFRKWLVDDEDIDWARNL